MTSSSGAAFRCNNLDSAELVNNIFSSSSSTSIEVNNLTNSLEDYNDVMARLQQ